MRCLVFNIYHLHFMTLQFWTLMIPQLWTLYDAPALDTLWCPSFERFMIPQLWSLYDAPALNTLWCPNFEPLLQTLYDAPALNTLWCPSFEHFNDSPWKKIVNTTRIYVYIGPALAEWPLNNSIMNLSNILAWTIFQKKHVFRSPYLCVGSSKTNGIFIWYH